MTSFLQSINSKTTIWVYMFEKTRRVLAPPCGETIHYPAFLWVITTVQPLLTYANRSLWEKPFFINPNTICWMTRATWRLSDNVKRSTGHFCSSLRTPCGLLSANFLPCEKDFSDLSWTCSINHPMTSSWMTSRWWPRWPISPQLFWVQ